MIFYQCTKDKPNISGELATLYSYSWVPKANNANDDDVEKSPSCLVKLFRNKKVV